MSRITGSDAFGLMEAYNNVYAPQELTEEQVWEEVEDWVNSLVEEGYDLSEYTWEDMYEEYLNEMGQPGGNRPGGNRPISNAPYQSRFARPMNAGTPQQTGRGTAVSRPQIGGLGGLGVGYRGAELQQAARARASQVGTPRQGTAGGPTTRGNTPIGPSPTRPAVQAPTTPARPSTTPARPAITPTSQKPVASSTTTAPTAPASTPAAPARTFNPLMQRTFGYQTGNAPSQIAAASAGKPIPSGTALGSAANPEVRRRLNLPQKNLNQNFDPFDVVLGHLIDEGYADTEEAAAVIMVNMSEEWREGILEKFGMAADPSKPQSPKATKLARKRKRHDDWESPGGEKVAQRARRVVGTQRRQDTETGVTK